MKTLYLMRLKSIAIEVYKITHGMEAKYLSDIVDHKENKYELRYGQMAKQPKFNTITYGLNSLRYKGPKIWNSLPNDFKECMSTEQFKKLIETWEGPVCYCKMCERLLDPNLLNKM